ncbi:39S ribosomal protein L3, mitochondrial [Platysternon megacephalum]|uniref:Dipeptidyl peptidase 3 n=1 Tax=Platysternon megacephalum TaxID=55544 RepID=A0A4D9F1E8_9SAUR|nr:39S ribosomal protein L3, mitochondrial [Platysternon megacephalum]
MVDSQYVLPNDVGLALLDCSEAFRLLLRGERLYAHYLSRACWYGGLVVLLQTSPEAPAIYVLLSRLFRAQEPDQLGELARSAGLADQEYQAFLVYAAGVFSNMGNYKSFGDTKFVPNLPKDKLRRLIWQSQAFQEQPEEMKSLWDRCGELMFSLDPQQRQLGLREKGTTTYFSGNCCLEDAQLAQKFLDSQNISAYNTRLFKEKDKAGQTCYEVRLASVLGTDAPVDHELSPKLRSFEFEGCTFRVTRGDYAPLLERVVENLQRTKACVPLPPPLCVRTELWGEGGLSQWLFYIGFIESYRDPYGSRGEFEGFVAVVNKAMSAKFAQLVESAEQLLLELPWPRAFEKDTFLTPDFTSLDVLTFAGSGIPAGINIPNYDDIRQTEGFKNVSLGNEEKGTCNFNREAVINPETGELIQSWYQGGETWDSKFSTIASSYEECRAECVGLYLCLNKDVLRIFELEGEDAEDVIYINWLNMVRAGLLGLEFYTPETGTWRQAGEGLVSLQHTTGADGKPDALITLNRNKILPVGKPAIERFLRRLQVLKSTADVAGGRALYGGFSAVTDEGPERFLSLRDTVLLRKEARKMFVQANTHLEGEDVTLVQYEGTAAGLIRSFSERFPEDTELLERHLLELSDADAHFWASQG